MSGTMQLLSEPMPEHGSVLAAAPGVWRVVAPNQGPMTLHGTNTYLVQTAPALVQALPDALPGSGAAPKARPGDGGALDAAPDGTAPAATAGGTRLEDAGELLLVDPGPDDARHVAAVLRAAAGRITCILLTHSHADHLGALAALRHATGAPTAGFHVPQDPAFRPDLALRDGEVVGGLLALHTPGHAADHLCFARADGVLLSGDHVMAWSTTVVSPPAGDMADYLASLRRLLAREDRLYLPGHGPALPKPLPFVRGLLQHRLMREAAILGRLGGEPVATAQLVAALYPGLAARLHAPAERSVLAHLLKLRAEGRALEQDGGWTAA